MTFRTKRDFLAMLPPQVEAAVRLGDVDRVVFVQRSLPPVRDAGPRAANGQRVIGGCTEVWPIELSVVYGGRQYGIGTFEAHAARAVLMVASMAFGLRVVHEHELAALTQQGPQPGPQQGPQLADHRETTGVAAGGSRQGSGGAA